MPRPSLQPHPSRSDPILRRTCPAAGPCPPRHLPRRQPSPRRWPRPLPRARPPHCEDTLGEDGSGIRYPDRGFLLLPPQASGGTMETMGPEKALRWLKEDLPRDGKVEEKDATIKRKKEASPTLVKLLDLGCFLCFFSMETLYLRFPCSRHALARFFTPGFGSMPFAPGSVSADCGWLLLD
ncbi:hypothetical protein SEVIR_9G486100v4 [Setaria viridis]|uniref:Uncharacterized protein n=1 Tax=Setaria viridis TaxID=4556 RepID=A0A4U6TJ09_SETVI|nr:hypothetical protein SEVIR_9G486100v2 [Setaria viridis]